MSTRRDFIRFGVCLGGVSFTSRSNATKIRLNLGESKRVVQYPAEVFSGRMGHFDKGFYMKPSNSRRDELLLYDRNGTLSYRARVAPEGASQVSITGYAVANQGRLVVSAGAITKEGIIGRFICFFNANGQATEIIRTNPFQAYSMCFGPGKSLWAIGLDFEAHNEGADYALIKKYTDSGVELNEYVFASSFVKGIADMVAQDSYLYSTNRGVCAYFKPTQEWLEFDNMGRLTLRGKTTVSRSELSRKNQSKSVAELAVTSSGQVYGLLWSTTHAAICKLDRERLIWKPVFDTLQDRSKLELTGWAGGRLIGADGDHLVVRDRYNRVIWFEDPNH